jgi:hypothetical protein
VGGSRTEESAYKYYKSLARQIGLSSLEGLLKKIPEEQQHLWHVHDGRAQQPFAAVAARADLGELLARLNVQEPARSQIVANRPALAEVVAWHLYAREEPGLAQPTSYLVRRLLAGDAPPLPQIQLASLSWEQWRTYAAAVAWGCPPEQGAWPLFDVWVEWYGAHAPEALPFAVGRGLDVPEGLPRRLDSGAGGLPAEGGAGEAGAAGRALWEEVLAELAPQMTRTTFNAWLRDTRFSARRGQTVVVEVRTAAAQAWLAHRLRAVIERALATVAGEEMEVVFVVVGDEAQTPAEAEGGSPNRLRETD